MRSVLFALVSVGLMMAGPAIAQTDIGSVTADLSSSMDGGPLDLDGTANGTIVLSGTTVFPITVPVTVTFSATTGGANGSNSGVAGLYMSLRGTAMGDNTGRSMTLNTVFTRPMGISAVSGVYSSIVNWTGPRGLGFDVLASGGGGGAGKIDEFGAVQALPDQMDFGLLDAQYTGHPAGAHPTVATNAGLPLGAGDQYAGAVDPVTLCTGSVVVSDLGSIELIGHALLWVSGGGAVVDPPFVGDSIVVVPEPGTLGLLGLVSVGFLSLRRWSVRG